MKERWFIKSFKGDFKRISDKYGISEITARLLVNRGIRTDTEIEEYLNAEKAELSEPSLMYDLDKACGILAAMMWTGYLPPIFYMIILKISELR